MSLIAISNPIVSECDRCHYTLGGHWFEDMNTGVEWFYCCDCVDKMRTLGEMFIDDHPNSEDNKIDTSWNKFTDPPDGDYSMTP